MVKAVDTNVPHAAQTGAGNTSTEDLQRQVEMLKSDISKLTESLGDYGRTKGREAQAEARRRADELRSEAQAKYDDVESYVRENPAQALGIAAGIGLLIGMLSRR
ncbi:hypothetical protein PARPLA_00232 [Rhodobacteraceae bacterium THAF1]|uniref:DUF883 family protein n=1 Tax=Palleronia sp. THAF1 TaxID=2587842 RepID=UPI000F3CB8DA|nr:DUF883 family protein [Palleronia sp. THAF1]QFU10203.1 hypothetical protein FIU81_16100 [Palleronia sp. THAF1]VDC16892.1 hypothetical protein PARPLA_00232 [Rhodobacteraceae bacterium THAF1]